MVSGTLRRRFRLSRKRALFAEEYVVDLNGTQAAIRSGYAERSAKITASRLLTNANVLEAVEWAFSERIQRVQLTADDVVRRLVSIAFTDLSAFASWTGNQIELKDLEDVPQDKHGALAGVEDTTQGLRIRMRDPVPALAILARHLGVIPTAGTREATAEHARVAYERTVTEKWDFDALSPEQLEQLNDILRTIRDAKAGTNA